MTSKDQADWKEKSLTVAKYIQDIRPENERGVSCPPSSDYAVMYTTLENNGLDFIPDEFRMLRGELASRDYTVLAEVNDLSNPATLLLVERPNGVPPEDYAHELIMVWQHILYRMIETNKPPAIVRLGEIIVDAMTEDDIPTAIEMPLLCGPQG